MTSLRVRHWPCPISNRLKRARSRVCCAVLAAPPPGPGTTHALRALAPGPAGALSPRLCPPMPIWWPNSAHPDTISPRSSPSVSSSDPFTRTNFHLSLNCNERNSTNHPVSGSFPTFTPEPGGPRNTLGHSARTRPSMAHRMPEGRGRGAIFPSQPLPGPALEDAAAAVVLKRLSHPTRDPIMTYP